MNRVVRGSDGRMWNVRSNFEWSDPTPGVGDFEHDVSGGPGPGIAMGSILLVLVIVFVLWTPQPVYIPGVLIIALGLLALFFPVRWLLHRPWTVTAETPGDEEEHPPEMWAGVVRGVLNVRNAVSDVARNIELYAQPDVSGPVQPVE